MGPKQRDRGRILTSDGLNRLQQAIRAWELEHEVRCTQERIKELTSATKEGGLDPGTIRKILKAKEGVDPESIRCLFTTFGLQLDEADLVASSRLQIQADPNFVGREAAIADLNALVNRGARVIVIQARGGVGKTTLARKYLQEFGSFLEFPIAKETKDIASVESLIEEKLRQLGEDPGREFFVSLDRLKRKLRDERIGILIDNLEPALDAVGKFIEPHRRYVELLRVLADPSLQAVTLITSRERLNEYSISVQHYLLRDLSLDAWKQYFQNRFQLFDFGRGVENEDESALAALHAGYGGNAKAMDILCGAILTDYAGNITAYWRANQDDLLIERALEDLVVGQFERLQQTDLDAYNLLCRMGCYRYQDVPTVPIEGLLCLLWDVPENRQRRVVKSLQERSLIDCENGEFWLHPVIRLEAIERLREGVDLEITNRKAGEFWTQEIQSVETIRDALTALEAYYHYFEINDFEKASLIILKERDNRWQRSEYLGQSLYRLGFPSQISLMILRVIENISPSYISSRLYMVLGTAYRMNGAINRAIECYEKSREIAHNLGFKRLEAYSFRYIGFCKIDLWEIEEAEAFLESYRKIIEDIELMNDSVPEPAGFYIHPTRTYWAYFAFINSCLNRVQKALVFVEKSYSQISTLNMSTSTLGYNLLCLGLTHKNLGFFEKALEFHNKALEFAKESHYTQLEANALIGLAAVYREKQNFKIAISYHCKSLEILKKLGAMSDLAESLYQLGLTYRAMNEIEKSNKSFQEAIRLFTEMGAPKQVERVRRSMQNENQNSFYC